MMNAHADKYELVISEQPEEVHAWICKCRHSNSYKSYKIKNMEPQLLISYNYCSNGYTIVDLKLHFAEDMQTNVVCKVHAQVCKCMLRCVWNNGFYNFNYDHAVLSSSIQQWRSEGSFEGNDRKLSYCSGKCMHTVLICSVWCIHSVDKGRLALSS
jgi:hypothetical protein